MIWFKTEGGHWQSGGIPPGWDPSWPAVFIKARHIRFGESVDVTGITGKKELHAVLDGIVLSLCQEPRVAELLRRTTEAAQRGGDDPILFALVPLGTHSEVYGPDQLEPAKSREALEGEIVDG